jgi:hypothetical protein
MAKKFINQTHIEGRLYQHDLTLKVTGENSKNPGTEFITGNIEIATDDAGINIIPVHFTYVTATTGSGKPNATYNVLKNIIDGIYKSVMTDGADNATMLRVDSAIGLNEFYADRNGIEELVSVKRNEGGFVHVAPSISNNENDRNTFECDIVITNVRRLEGDADKGTSDKVIVKGAIFNFRKDLLPVEFSVTNPKAMNYFEDLGASTSSPVFTKIKGRQISESIVRRVEEESAFGEPSIREYKSTRKDFVITWAMAEPYAWDDESTITAMEMKEAMANREIALAEMKKRNDDYKASRNGGAVSSAPAAGAFNF